MSPFSILFASPAVRTTIVLGALSFLPSLVASPDGQGSTPLVACDRCEGLGEVACPMCEGLGKERVPCSKCKGRDSIDCSVRRCNEGTMTCKACRGKGAITVKVIRVTGGASSRIKVCGGCAGKGSTKCPRCEGGRHPCPRCRSGKKQFHGRCETCAAKKKIVCDSCAGVGMVAPPPLHPKLVKKIERLRQTLNPLKRGVEATAAKVEKLRRKFADSRGSFSSLQSRLDDAGRVEKLGLTASLERYRLQLTKDFEAQKTAFSSGNAEPTLDRLDDHVASARGFRDKTNAELEGVLARNDGRRQEEIEARIVRIRAEMRERAKSSELTKRTLKRAGIKITKLDRRTKSLRKGFSSFFERHAVNKHKAEEARKREEAENREPSLAFAVREALRTANKQQKIPELRLRGEPDEDDDGGAKAAIEYLDAEASPLGDEHSTHVLTERYLRRIPATARAVFMARKEIAAVELNIVSTVAGDGEDGDSGSLRRVQRFTFERDLLLPDDSDNSEGDEGDGDEDAQPADWKALLAQAEPMPPFPPATASGWASVPVQVALYATLLLCAGALIWVSRKRFGATDEQEEVAVEVEDDSVWLAEEDDETIWRDDDPSSAFEAR